MVNYCNIAFCSARVQSAPETGRVAEGLAHAVAEVSPVTQPNPITVRPNLFQNTYPTLWERDSKITYGVYSAKTDLTKYIKFASWVSKYCLSTSIKQEASLLKFIAKLHQSLCFQPFFLGGGNRILKFGKNLQNFRCRLRVVNRFRAYRDSNSWRRDSEPKRSAG